MWNIAQLPAFGNAGFSVHVFLLAWFVIKSSLRLTLRCVCTSTRAVQHFVCVMAEVFKLWCTDFKLKAESHACVCVCVCVCVRARVCACVCVCVCLCVCVCVTTNFKLKQTDAALAAELKPQPKGKWLPLIKTWDYWHNLVFKRPP
jgi:hypothetical protein